MNTSVPAPVVTSTIVTELENGASEAATTLEKDFANLVTEFKALTANHNALVLEVASFAKSEGKTIKTDGLLFVKREEGLFRRALAKAGIKVEELFTDVVSFFHTHAPVNTAAATPVAVTDTPAVANPLNDTPAATEVASDTVVPPAVVVAPGDTLASITAAAAETQHAQDEANASGTEPVIDAAAVPGEVNVTTTPAPVAPVVDASAIPGETAADIH
jgi:hypothetical protein